MSARDKYRDREIASLTVGASEVVLESNGVGPVSLNVYGSDGSMHGYQAFGDGVYQDPPRLAIEFAHAILAALDDRPRFVLAHNARGARGVLDRQTNLFAPGGNHAEDCNEDPSLFLLYFVSPFDGVDPLAPAALPESEDQPEPGPEPEPSEPAYTVDEIVEALLLIGGFEPYETPSGQLETALAALRALKGVRS